MVFLRLLEVWLQFRLLLHESFGLLARNRGIAVQIAAKSVLLSRIGRVFRVLHAFPQCEPSRAASIVAALHRIRLRESLRFPPASPADGKQQSTGTPACLSLAPPRPEHAPIALARLRIEVESAIAFRRPLLRSETHVPEDHRFHSTAWLRIWPASGRPILLKVRVFWRRSARVLSVVSLPPCGEAIWGQFGANWESSMRCSLASCHFLDRPHG